MYTKIFYLLLSAFLLLSSTLCFASEKIVVIPAKNKSSIQNTAYEDRFTSLIEEQLMKLGKYEVINRKDLKDIILEQKFATTGLADPEQAVEIGKIAQAKKALIANILDIIDSGDKKEIIAEIKIINVETSLVLNIFNIKESSIEENSVDNAIIYLCRNFYARMKDKEEEAIFELEKKSTIDRIELEKKINAEKLSKKRHREKPYFNIGFTLSGFDINNFSTSSKFVKLESIPKGCYGFNVELGKDIFLANGGYYTNSVVSIYQTGIGISGEIYEADNFDIRGGTLINLSFFDGKIGKTLYNTDTANNTFLKESKVDIAAMTTNVAPFIKFDYNMKNFTLFANISYNIFSTTNKYTLTITDSSDKSKTENISLDSFDPNLSLDGFGIKTGIQFKF